MTRFAWPCQQTLLRCHVCDPLVPHRGLLRMCGREGPRPSPCEGCRAVERHDAMSGSGSGSLYLSLSFPAVIHDSSGVDSWRC